MNAEQAKFLAQSVGQQLQHEWMTTYKVISAVPEAKRDYKPEENSRSAWDLATHIAGADIWFLDGVIKGEFDKPSDTPPAPTVSGVAEWYKQEFPKRLERALALEGHQLTKPVDFFGMKMPAVQYMMFALIHMVHHRGQLATYLRPMGSKCPSIYGGSFDEKWQGPAEVNA